MDTLLRDARHAVRLLFKNPGFALVAVLTLGLGIGGNTAVFSVVNTVLLRPLPYPDADRIVRVREERPEVRGRALPSFMTSTTLQAWREDPQTVDAIAGYGDRSYTLTGEDAPVRVRGADVSPAMFSLLRATPLMGRVLELADEQRGNHLVVVLSHDAWQQRFGGDPDIIGRPLVLDDAPHTVVGVMPPSFYFPDHDAELWTPMVLPAQTQSPGTRRLRAFSALARLSEGVALEQAQAEGQVVLLAQERPGPLAGLPAPTLRLIPMQEEMVGEARPALLALLAAVGFVLLIAIANLANLLLARGSARQREFAVRAAIGAGKARLSRQLMTESLVLGLVGGGVGLLIAWGIVTVLPSVAPPEIPRLDELALDGRVLGFALLTSILTSLVFGLVPVLQVSSVNLVGALNESAPQMGGGFRFRRGNRTRSLLAIVEVALSLVLLVGAGLLVKSFVTLTAVDPGYDPANVLTARIDLPRTRYTEMTTRADFFDQLVDRVATRPGVEAAGLVRFLPLTRGEAIMVFRIAGRPAPTSRDDMTSGRPQFVSPGYREAMGLRMIDGRFLTERDTENAPSALVVNETFARAYFQSEQIVGQQLNLFGADPWEIVGVVGDVRHQGLDSEPQPEFYLSYRQAGDVFRSNTMNLVVRTTGDPTTLVPFLRQDLRELDPNVTLDSVMTMGARLSASVAQPRFYTLVLAAFSTLAVALAVLGLYGVLAYTVSQRRHEIGVRMALGADNGDIRALVVRQGLLLVGIGIILGLGGAVATTRGLETLLFGVDAIDRATFVVVPVLLAAVAAVACYLPAVRATRLNPLETLRHE